MCRNSLIKAWIASVLALVCCLGTNIHVNATTNCFKNGPIEDDPPENPKKPCGYCRDVPAEFVYQKCDTNPDPTSQRCNQPTIQDGVVCDGTTDICQGNLRSYTADDCSGDPIEEEEQECEREYDEAWWDDEGDEPFC